MDLRRAVRAAVQLENPIVEVLDAEAETSDAEIADDPELGFGERAGLAFERDLGGAAPVGPGRQPRNESLQLRRRQERRGAAAKVDEVHGTAGDRRGVEVHVPLIGEQAQIVLDLAGVLVRVDAEVAEVTPLAAERNVQIEPERHRRRRRIQRNAGIVQSRGRPDGKRGVIRNKVAPDRRFVAIRDIGQFGHLPRIRQPGRYRLPQGSAFRPRLVPALSFVEGPALSFVEGPALSFVEGPALSFVEGPALSFVEGPALSFVEGPALSFVEGPALSLSKGRRGPWGPIWGRPPFRPASCPSPN